MNGYEFAYMNPGINKVLQALGRVIRTQKDKGSALIIDSRYAQSHYFSVLTKIKDSNGLIKALNSFYKN